MTAQKCRDAHAPAVRNRSLRRRRRGELTVDIPHRIPNGSSPQAHVAPANTLPADAAVTDILPFRDDNQTHRIGRHKLDAS